MRPPWALLVLISLAGMAGFCLFKMVGALAPDPHAAAHGAAPTSEFHAPSAQLPPEAVAHVTTIESLANGQSACLQFGYLMGEDRRIWINPKEEVFSADLDCGPLAKVTITASGYSIEIHEPQRPYHFDGVPTHRVPAATVTYREWKR